MIESKAREFICEMGRSMFERRLTFGSSGNISMRIADGWLMTPTGSSSEPRATKKRAWPLARASCQSFSMGSSKSSQMTSGRGTMMDSTLESATAKTPSTKRCSAAWNTP